MAEKKVALTLITDDKRESKRYNDAILTDFEKVCSYACVLKNEAKKKKR